MKNIFFSICFCFCAAYTNAQDKAFAVWQGFEHKWMYNHRLNRLGDYIAQSPFQQFPHTYHVVHTGATGLGKDTAIFRSYFATVRSKDLDFFPGVEQLKLSGRQGDLFQITKRIYIVDAELAKKPQLAVVFNGFDLVSESGADKLQLFKIQFSDPVRRNRSDTIELSIEAAIVVDCRSFECNRFNKQFRYDLKLRYLVLGAAANSMHITMADYNESVFWTRQMNAPENVQPRTLSGNPGYSNAFLAFKNLFIVLNHDHWILSYANALTRSDYQAASGTMRLQHIAYIRQWESGMKQVSTQSMFSEKREGWGMLQGSMQLIQFRHGRVDHFERIGYIDWAGNNEKAESPLSVNTEQRQVK